MPVSTTLLTLCSNAESCRVEVLESAITLAHQIAANGGEGRRTGALITIGRAADVLRLSRPLILNPLQGHGRASTHITNPDLRGTVKVLSQLDGAFVVDGDGTVVAACRYLDVPTGNVDVPLGLGSRHVAAASISKQLGIFAIVVSQSGVVRAFYDGTLFDATVE